MAMPRVIAAEVIQTVVVGEGVHAGRADHRADDGVLDKRKVCCQEREAGGLPDFFESLRCPPKS